MKILFINKFLHKNGGSETYIFKLGEYLESAGHSVEYFGMEHEGRIVGNNLNLYTSDMDFHSGSILKKLTYPVKTIYSFEARRKIRAVLDDFMPDVCHINNFNFQLTPSIILEIVKWRKQTGKNCEIIYTAHDYQLVCPNHMCRNPITDENCEKCLSGKFINCAKNKCIHSSFLKSVVGSIEGYFWKMLGVYERIDKIVCPSDFIKTKLDVNPQFSNKTLTIHNFLDKKSFDEAFEKQDYLLYFGRFSKEKGVRTLVEVAKELPQIQFVFAGGGPLEDILNGAPNIKNVGFKSGDELKELIGKARFTIYPSEWYENCPFSVMESQMYNTPVLGADIGGIPELISVGKTGELFESGNIESLKESILSLWNDGEKTKLYSLNCKDANFIDIKSYCQKIYQID